MIQNYRIGLKEIDEKIKSEMKLCSFDLKCEGLELDFVKRGPDISVRRLYKDDDIYSFFELPSEDGYLLKVIMKKSTYKKRVSKLKKELLNYGVFYILWIIFISVIFTIYALYPLKKALKINDEFIKDVLHDINTPLSSMLINFKLLKKEIGVNRKLERMEHNINMIISLQDNLKTFLDSTPLQKERFLLRKILEDRANYFQELYPLKNFSINDCDRVLETNVEAFIQIVDNIVSNSCKYSQKDAKISLTLIKDMLYIEDNGIGIKDTKKIFDRYYKESERGIGIGMSIVKKLCDALNISISIKSKVGDGTVIILGLDKVMVR